MAVVASGTELQMTPPSDLQLYDRIGPGYAQRRRADPRLAQSIGAALGDARTVLNVGAGAGSYEPVDRWTIAAEPSRTMIHQRPPGSGPVVQARAEALPFASRSFDAALAVLAVHHWSDWRLGVSEMLRVSRDRVVLLTWDPDGPGFWLVADYFPEVLAADRARFPRMGELEEAMGDLEVIPVPIPHDCTDGFMGAFWRRPSAYLDPDVRGAMSSLATGASPAALARLADDLATGTWHQRYASYLDATELDLGYRLVIGKALPLGARAGEG